LGYDLVCIGKDSSPGAPTFADPTTVVVKVIVLVVLTIHVGVGMWRQSQALEMIDAAWAVT